MIIQINATVCADVNKGDERRARSLAATSTGGLGMRGEWALTRAETEFMGCGSYVCSSGHNSYDSGRRDVHPDCLPCQDRVGGTASDHQFSN